MAYCNYLSWKFFSFAINLIAVCAISTGARAGNVSVKVVDKDGNPAPDAVVMVLVSGKSAAAPSPPPGQVTIYQKKMRFVPAISVVALGAQAQFVNQDPWEHHVRASAAGLAQFNAAADGFELRLDGKADGKPAHAAQATFNKVGAVLLGCHIHGSMRGHVYVSESPWAVLSGADGIATLEQVPDGAVQVKVWHPDQLIEMAPQPYTVDATSATLTLKLSVLPRRRRV